jgi:polyhydroxybutyrate depolymerase
VWLALVLPAEGVGAQSPDIGTLESAGVQRRYVVHAPQRQAGAALVPLVIVLHGAGGNGRNALEQGRWVEKADAEGFVVVAPEGTAEHEDRRRSLLSNPQTWNAGPGIGSSAAARGVDDVGFIRDLIDELVRTRGIDPRRVFVTGFSNGAAMAFRVGAELSDRVAAIAPVSNGLLVPVPALARPVSLLLIWGTADPLNPFAGGIVKRGGQHYQRPSAVSSWKTWSRALACEGSPNSEALKAGVARQAFERCADRSAAEFISIEGLGHQWPGGRVYIRVVAGSGSDALDATDRIWDFFSAHGR